MSSAWVGARYADEAPGTLSPTEWHPAAESAHRWLAEQPGTQIILWSEALASVAMTGNRTAEVCSETLRRVMVGEPVSDRYLLGLVWTLRDMAEARL